MANQPPPSKRRRRLPNPIPSAFSSFARYLSNSRIPLRPTPLIGSEPKPEPKHPIKSNKPVEPSPSSSSSEDSDSEPSLEMVQADFGFFDPKPGDFGGVKLLLQKYLDDAVWDLSGFVDLILQQTTVGTVVKLDSDENEGDGDSKDGGGGVDDGLYAVVSLLNLGRYAGHQCIGEIKKFLLESCKDECTKKKLKLLLEEQAKDVGLLVSQRFVNCPHQLVPPLYDGLFDEISWATEDEPTQELQDSFRVKYYLLLSKIYENKNVNQRKARVKHDYNDEPIIYVKPEDEIFRELCSFSFTFPLSAEQVAPRELKNYRMMGLAMAVKSDEVSKFRTKLKSLLAES